jgi:hypothetical protein
MNDQSRPLHQILDELQEALEAAPEVGEEGRAALRKAAEDIRTALDEPEGSAATSLSDQLTEALERFEEDHPQLTSIVGRITETLSDIGI